MEYTREDRRNIRQWLKSRPVGTLVSDVVVRVLCEGMGHFELKQRFFLPLGITSMARDGCTFSYMEFCREKWVVDGVFYYRWKRTS